MGISNIASGSLTGCEVDVKLIFAMALKTRAAKIILAHNHPSGRLLPSYEDEMFTKRCVEAGSVLGIEIIDHVVLTKEGYCSFDDKNMI